MLFAVIGTSTGKSREEIMAVYPRHKGFLDSFVGPRKRAACIRCCPPFHPTSRPSVATPNGRAVGATGVGGPSAYWNLTG